MRLTVTDRVAWSVVLSVCLSVTVVSPTETAEPIEILLGLWTWGGPKELCSRQGSRSPLGRGNFDGEMGCPLQSIGTLQRFYDDALYKSTFYLLTLLSYLLYLVTYLLTYLLIFCISELYKKRLNRTRCRSECGLGWAEGSTC